MIVRNEEAPAVANREQVGDHIDDHERDREDREPLERYVVFEREDPARLSVRREWSDAGVGLRDVLLSVV